MATLDRLEQVPEHDKHGGRSTSWIPVIIFLAPALLVYAGFTLYPVLKTFYNSVQVMRPHNVVQFIGFGNFRGLLTKDVVFCKAVRNTAIFSVVGTVLDVAGGLILALCLFAKVPLARFGRVVWFSPVLISYVVVGIIWVWIYDYDWGVVNSVLRWVGLGFLAHSWLGDPHTALWAVLATQIWKWVGFNMIVFLAALYALPADVLGAAELEHCRWFAKLCYIILPMLRPAVVSLLVLSSAGKMMMFDVVWIMTRGGPLWSTETVSTYVYKRAFDWNTFDLGYPSALLFFGAGDLVWGATPAPLVTPTPTSKPITRPLTALSTNPNYFTDGSGQAIYLTGSHTWNTLQDWGTNGSVQPLDFTAFVKMLVAHHHNFTLLWTTELPKFHGLPTTASSPPDFSVAPHPWQRTGPGSASDGKLKFDLTKFNQAYFDRLRDRVQRLDAAGIYAGVYFFTGEFLNVFRSPSDGYPFTGSNNVNEIDDGGGIRSETMTAPKAVTVLQDAYVRKMIDTLNDLPNVLWIVSEEAPANSISWNNHVITTARSYEAGKPLQHPIGYAVLQDSSDATIINSDADWIAPSARISPTTSCGSGHPRCKVNINDSDHSYFGMWNESPRVNRNYFWINFTQGNQTLFMDPYVAYYPRENRNLPQSHVINGISSAPDTRWENVRNTMGYIRGYAERMNLAVMTPQEKLSSTGHVLANTSAANPELLVYAPSGGEFSVDLSSNSGRFAVEWTNPETGDKTAAADVSGGARKTFAPPFNGDAVLYLRLKVSSGAQRH